MTTRVYVGRLPYRAKERDLEDFFYKYGRLRDVIIKNGFAFVEFEDPRDAEEAAHYMNGKELCGERVIVELTKRPPKGRDAYRTSGTRYLVEHYGRGRSGGSYGGGGYNRSPPSRRRDGEGGGSYPHPTQTRWRVIVENLSSRVSWQDLKDFMRQAGEVCYSDAHRIHKNEGVVCFTNESEMRRALETLDGKELNGRKIKLIDGSRRSGSRSSSASRSRSRSASGSRSRSRSPRGKRASSSRSRSRSPRSRSRSPSAGGKGAPVVKKESRSRSRSESQSKSRSGSPPANGKNDDE